MTEGARRRVGFALVASLALHLVTGAIYAVGAARLLPMPDTHALRRPANDEIVTLSSAIRFEKRARPVLPVAAVRARIARPEPDARRGPRAPRVDVATAARERVEDPLRSSARGIAAAPKRYRLQIDGSDADLRHGEGHYTPVRAWHRGGLDYYMVSYAFTYANGNFERGLVPWPVHFKPSEDPFAHPELARTRHTPLPGPPPDYVPPGTLARALRAFFPKLRFEPG